MIKETIKNIIRGMVSAFISVVSFFGGVFAMVNIHNSHPWEAVGLFIASCLLLIYAFVNFKETGEAIREKEKEV